MSAALQIEAAEPTRIALTELKIDPELQCRARGTNKQAVREYSQAMLAGTVFPAVVVFVDGKGSSWLADGFHRCAAAELAGLTEVAADVRQGSRKDALLHAASSNSSHGLRRTTADKRHSIVLVLGNFPKWSDRKIAEACGVDHKTVGATRARLSKPEAGEIPHGEPPDSESVVVSKLSAKLDQTIAQWPDNKHTELRSYLTAVLQAMSG